VTPTVGNLYLVSVWLHILAAAAWLGTLVFIAAVLVPTLRSTGDEGLRSKVMRAAGPRLRTFGWVTFAVLVVTGIGNLAGRGFAVADLGWRLWQGPFGRAFGWKMALFTVVLVLSALHDFRWGPRAAAAAPGSPAALRLRRLASWVGRIELLLGLAIVLLAVFLVRGWPG
jgi:putative copper resistance protein D